MFFSSETFPGRDDESIAKQILGKYLSADPKYKEEQIRFVSSVMDVLSTSNDPDQIFLVKDSKKRVEKILGNQKLGIKGFSLSELASAISFDISSYKGIYYEPEEVIASLKRVNEVVSSVLSFVDFYLRASGRVDPDMYVYYDRNETMDFAYDYFSKFMWNVWSNDASESIEVVIDKLYARVAMRLRFFPKKIMRLFFKNANLYRGYYDDPCREDIRPRIQVDSSTHAASNDKSWEGLGDTFRKSGIQLLPCILSILSPREAFALLRKFGYVYPQLNVEQFDEAFGVDHCVIDVYFSRAVAQITKLNPHQIDSSLNPNLSIADFVQKYETPPFYCVEGRVVPMDSPRSYLPEVCSEQWFFSQLTNIELEVVELAVMVNPDRPLELLHSLQAIHEITGLSYARVSHILTLCGKLYTGEIQRYINCEGEEIRFNTPQAKLIRISNCITQEQLSMLSQYELEMCLYLTTPNMVSGRYPTVRSINSDVSMKLRYRHLQAIVKKIGISE